MRNIPMTKSLPALPLPSRLIVPNLAEEVHPSSNPPMLNVSVVFTSIPETLLALRRAADLAVGLAARIRILVPEIVPFPIPLTEPPVCRAVRNSHLRTLAAQSSIETWVQVVLCRDRLIGLIQILEPGSTVVIGGVKHWWPTKEKRLANALSTLGHRVLFVSK